MVIVFDEAIRHPKHAVLLHCRRLAPITLEPRLTPTLVTIRIFTFSPRPTDMAVRGRHSYISSEDLASLDLSPPTTPTEHSQPASAATKAPHSSDSPPPSYRDNEEDASSLRTSRKCHKRVLFCPLALLIETAAEGEKDPWLSERAALAQRTGRPRLAVRTYS